MYSLDLGRLVSFPAGTAGGSNQSPAWSGDGSKLAFSSSRTGDPEIWVADASGAAPKRITYFKGPDVSPTWNPKTNAQIAWVSGRTGLPQIYTMDQDGANIQRLTDGGYAVSPSWSPNGQFLTFSWNRKYGPGAPGRPGHLHHGHCHKAVAAVDARRRKQRFSVVGAGHDGTSFSSGSRVAAQRFGRCWQMAQTSIS